MERSAKIDDPVGAISVHGVCGVFGVHGVCGVFGVHGVCGVFGVLALGIFADGKYGAGWNATGNAIADPVSTGVTGAIKGDWGQLGAQVVGALVICTVMFGTAFAFFKVQDSLTKGGIRSDEADELAGLDMPELALPAYPEFMPGEVVDVTGSGKDPEGEREYVTSGAAPRGEGWPSAPSPS